MTRPTLVIVADDLGLSPEVDAGILETVRAGTVTTVDLLINPPFEADFRSIESEGATVGLHLNLTLGSPCSPPNTVGSLVTSDGRFSASTENRHALRDPGEVLREWEAQLSRFFERVGHAPCHISVHKHLHRADPRLFRLAASLARQCGAPLRTLDPAMRDLCRAMGVGTTDRFIGDVQPAPYWTPERLHDQLLDITDGLTELMCHPGRHVTPIPNLWYLSERDVERETFCSQAAREWLARFRLEPCSTTLFKGPP